MRELYITNSLSRKKEIFKPLNEGHVGLYVCGPTVYGDAHLGHARPGVTYDVFVKLLKLRQEKLNWFMKSLISLSLIGSIFLRQDILCGFGLLNQQRIKEE
mgnify:CR=1 FL=1